MLPVLNNFTNNWLNVKLANHISNPNSISGPKLKSSAFSKFLKVVVVILGSKFELQFPQLLVKILTRCWIRRPRLDILGHRWAFTTWPWPWTLVVYRLRTDQYQISAKSSTLKTYVLWRITCRRVWEMVLNPSQNCPRLMEAELRCKLVSEDRTWKLRRPSAGPRNRNQHVVGFTGRENICICTCPIMDSQSQAFSAQFFARTCLVQTDLKLVHKRGIHELLRFHQ